jgi:hypothetical protein
MTILDKAKKKLLMKLSVILVLRAAQRGLWPPVTTRFVDHTQRRATVGRTPLDE